MEDLQSLLATDPNVQEIHLNERELEEIDSLMPFLAKCRHLEALDLSDNYLKSLPHNLSSLSQLHTLNINNNPFEAFPDVVASLQTLPALQRLSLNLQKNEEVELVLTSLPNLVLLNEQDVGHDESEEHNASGEEEKVQDADQLENDEEKQDLEQPDQEQMVYQEEEEVEPIQKEEDQELQQEEVKHREEEGEEEEELKLEDLEEVVKIYDAFRAFRKKTDPSNDKRLEKEFEQKMSEMANDLKKALSESQSSELKNACILKARHDILDITFGKMVESVSDKSFANLWKNVRTEHNAVVEGLLGVISKMRPAIAGNLEGAQHEVEKAQKETHEVLEAAKHLEGELQKHVNEKEELKRQFDSERKELLGQIASLEEENKKYLDTIIKRSKMAGLPSASISAKDSPARADSGSRDIKRLVKPLPTGVVGPTQVRTLTLKQLKDLIQDMYLQKQKYDEKCAESRLPRETMEQYMYTYLNQRYGLKNLIIEWAAAIINGIRRYSLEDSDVALFGKILRNECDEDFRFVHNEVKSAMTDILREKIKRRFKHKTEGEITKLVNDVQTGEIDEWQWKEIIRKMYNEEHFAILEQRIRDRIAERNPQVNRAERRRLTREELLALQSQKERSLPFVDFQKIVLDFQLATHEKYIKKFVILFKKLDTDTNGILSEDEFKQLVAMMRVISGEEDVERLLQIVDPYNNQQITFSECLALLSSENITFEIRDQMGMSSQRIMSLLEKFVTDEVEELSRVPEVPSPGQ